MDIDELRRLAVGRQRAVRTMVSIKSKYDIDIVDVVVFLVLGMLNFEKSNSSLLNVQPMTISSVSDFIGIPKETVRRKLSLLEQKSLISKTNYGFLVKDITVWKQLVESSASTNEPVMAERR
jgi:predicted transcriptional regulator